MTLYTDEWIEVIAWYDRLRYLDLAFTRAAICVVCVCVFVCHYPSDKCFFIHLHLNAEQVGKQEKNCVSVIFTNRSPLFDILYQYVLCECGWVCLSKRFKVFLCHLLTALTAKQKSFAGYLCAIKDCRLSITWQRKKGSSKNTYDGLFVSLQHLFTVEKWLMAPNNVISREKCGALKHSQCFTVSIRTNR